MQPKLVELLHRTPEYRRFLITTKNIKGIGGHERKEPNLASWTNFASRVRCELAKQKDKPLSVIELTMSCLDTGRQRNERADYYGFSTAHGLMSEKQKKILACSGGHLEKVWQEIVDECWNEKPFMRVTGHRSIDTVSRPIFQYRYWYLASQTDDHACVTDMMMFRFDERQLRDDNWLENDQPISCQYGQGTSAESDDITEIAKLRTDRDVMNLVGRKVICSGKVGTLIPSVTIEDSGWTYGAHICFTLDNGSRLVSCYLYVLNTGLVYMYVCVFACLVSIY